MRGFTYKLSELMGDSVDECLLPVTVVVLTYNAGDGFNDFCSALQNQNIAIEKVLVIDSSSKDNTAAIAKEFGFEVIVIDRQDFGHGKTRQYALERTQTEYVVYLTQDALLYDEFAIENLLRMMSKYTKMGACFGRQVPYPYTGVLGSFVRLFNYPAQSRINRLEDRKTKGIKTCFSSDSFCGYRKSLLNVVGGFPDVSFSEDAYVAAKLLLAGYETGYCAEAKVYHAHNYSIIQEFYRYRKIGKFYRSQAWLLEEFGKAEGEGLKFVLAEAKWLISRGYWYMLPLAFIHNFVKFLGYKIG